MSRRCGGLQDSYRLLAPVYDWIAGPAFAAARRASLQALPAAGPLAVLIDGIGTGLDLPYLPRGHRYTGLDLTRPMLRRALPRGRDLDMRWVQGDSMNLPFRAGSFDCVVLHLILAVVADPAQALAETSRVLKPGGRALVLDKFLRPGENAPLRRLLSPFTARIATRTDVVFEAAHARSPELVLVSDEPALARGWFRRIVLERRRG